jgi:hypothetical protein
MADSAFPLARSVRPRYRDRLLNTIMADGVSILISSSNSASSGTATPPDLRNGLGFSGAPTVAS